MKITTSSKAMKRLTYLTSEIGATYHTAAVKLGLSDSVMEILYTVCDYGESCLLTDICRLTGMSKQTINSAIRKLEHSGIIRLEFANSKSKIVVLTEQGKLFVENTVAKLIKAENDIFDTWSKEEVEQYISLTEQYLIALKKKMVAL